MALVTVEILPEDFVEPFTGPSESPAARAIRRVVREDVSVFVSKPEIVLVQPPPRWAQLFRGNRTHHVRTPSVVWSIIVACWNEPEFLHANPSHLAGSFLLEIPGAMLR